MYRRGDRVARRARSPTRCRRSEEHTSELQSQSNLVCRLLLEKKKKLQHSACLRVVSAAIPDFEVSKIALPFTLRTAICNNYRGLFTYFTGSGKRAILAMIFYM